MFNIGRNAVSASSLPGNFFEKYDSYHVSSFSRRHFPPDVLYAVLQRLAGNSQGLIDMRHAGDSFEKRPVYLLKAGTGGTRVLFWSQMHGDEPTATMAICDLLKYLIVTNKEEATREMLSRLTLYFVPMLNPDGAVRVQRRTAQGIDMNRDALALVTPEARLLKGLQQDLHPEFGFNLHDQELSTVAGSTALTMLALLAPAYDQPKSMNEVRHRAQQLSAHIACAVAPFTGHALARYDDSFEPRAFGDNMQRWGTSTVLVEAGHALKDPEKKTIRRVYAVALLSSIYAIADGSYQQADVDVYQALPLNGKHAFDVIIRNIQIEHGGGEKTKADLGVSYQVDTHSEETPRLAEVGDLSTFIGLKEIDGGMKKIPSADLAIGKEFRWETYPR